MNGTGHVANLRGPALEDDGLGRRLLKVVQPESVNGSPEAIIETGVTDGAQVFGGWGQLIADRIPVTDNALRIATAIYDAERACDLDEASVVIDESLMRGMMLGALDNQYEVLTDNEVDPPEYTAAIENADFRLVEGTKGFTGFPYQKAVDEFLAKKPLTRKSFDALSTKSKTKAFTVAGASRESIVATVQRELASQVQRGSDLKEFRHLVVPRLEQAGWTPKNPSHVENVFRTNVAKAYAAGRVEHAMRPTVLKFRPIWVWRGIQDGPPRQRPSHFKAHGYAMFATNGEWGRIYPPAGWQCRCRTTSTSEKGAKRFRVVDSILALIPDLVDKGFTAGVASLMGDFGVGEEQEPAPKAQVQVPVQVEPTRPAVPPMPAAPPTQALPNVPSDAFEQLPIEEGPEPAAGIFADPVVTQHELNQTAILEAAGAKLARSFLEAHPNITDLKRYTSHAYEDINNALRKWTPGMEPTGRQASALERAKAVQTILTEAASNGHALRGTVLRGERGYDIRGEVWKTYMTADEITFKGFTSTTTQTSIQKSFGQLSEDPDTGAVLLKIRQFSGVPLEGITQVEGEREVLIPAGRRFRVIHRAVDTEKRVMILELEEVEAGAVADTAV